MPDIPMSTLPFPVVTEDEFPQGLSCPACKRPLAEGEPYIKQVQSVDDDGTVGAVITCVYCPWPAPSVRLNEASDRLNEARAEALRDAVAKIEASRTQMGIAARALDPGKAYAIAVLDDMAERLAGGNDA